jgi:hypothetical protein
MELIEIGPVIWTLLFANMETKLIGYFPFFRMQVKPLTFHFSNTASKFRSGHTMYGLRFP